MSASRLWLLGGATLFAVMALALWLLPSVPGAHGEPDPDGFRHALGERTLAALAEGGVLTKGTVSHPEWVECFAGTDNYAWGESNVEGIIISQLSAQELFAKVDPAMAKLGWRLEAVGQEPDRRFWTREMTEASGPKVLLARMSLDPDSTVSSFEPGWRIGGQIPSSSIDDLAC